MILLNTSETLQISIAEGLFLTLLALCIMWWVNYSGNKERKKAEEKAAAEKQKPKYWILTVQQSGSLSPATIWYIGDSFSRFLLIERELGRKTSIIHSHETEL